MCPDIGPLILRENGRDTGDGAGGNYCFSVQDDGNLGLQKSTQHAGAALYGHNAFRLEGFT